MADYDLALGRMWELAVLLGEDMERGLTREGLTRSRAHLLWELHQRGSVTQRVLAQALDVSARNITGLIGALVDTGFVTRKPHPTDRRATLVTLTERGAKTVDAMDRRQQEFANALFSSMPAEALDGFVEGLGMVLARLRELNPQREGGAGSS
ncbi:MAG: MarR family transcriptional regulator [Actinomycetota bacterium]|nr:MarR family transcriptional regulator [Actinomycetota bacterium]